MAELFLKILDLSIKSSYIIVFVLVFRLLLKKAPKIFSYALWGLVFIRLIFPFTIESPYSFLKVRDQLVQEKAFIENIQGPKVNSNTNQGPELTNNNTSVVVEDLNIPRNHKPQKLRINEELIYTGIWAGGILVLLSYSFLSTRKLEKKLINSKIISDGVYLNESIETAFVFGILKAKIYLPLGLTEEESLYILKHERVHIERKDHIIKLLAFLITTLHWFNPLVWISYYLLGVDMELSCDERVIKDLGIEIKKEYSTSLLSFSTGKKILTASPIAFGENNTKNRIKNILRYRKPKTWMMVLGVLTLAITSLGCLTETPKAEKYTKSENTKIQDKKEVDEKEIEKVQVFESSEETINSYIEEIINGLEKRNYKISEKRIDKFEKINSYNYLMGNEVEVWALNFSLRFEDLEDYNKFAGFIGGDGGEGWVTNIHDGDYLIFERVGKNTSYLGALGDTGFEYSMDSNKMNQEAAIRAALEREKLIEAETFPGIHSEITFRMSDGSKAKLLLSKPIRQDDSGIWVVERWIDTQGNTYYWTYDNEVNLKANEYFANIQERVDQGKDLWRLNPLDVGLDYVHNIIGQTQVNKESLEIKSIVNLEDFYEIPVSEYLGYFMDIQSKEENEIGPNIDIDNVELILGEDTERLEDININLDELSNGYYIYNPTTYPNSIFLTEDTKYKVSISGGMSEEIKEVSLEEFEKYAKSKGADPLIGISSIKGNALEVEEVYTP